MIRPVHESPREPLSSRRTVAGVVIVALAAFAAIFFATGQSTPPPDATAPQASAALSTSTPPSPTTSSTRLAPPPIVSSTTTVAGAPLLPGTILGAGWEDLNFGPLSGGRNRMAITWTGTELFAWGGYVGGLPEVPRPSGFLQDGYLYDPEADSWRPVAEPPDELCLLGPADAMWLDRVVLVYGVAIVEDDCATAALFDPDSDTWRVLRGEFFDAVRADLQLSLVWTGELLVAPTRGVAFEPTTEATIHIPVASVVGGSSSPVRGHWTGEFVVAIGSGTLQTWAVGDDAWTSHPGPPVPKIARDSVWTDDGLLVVNYQMATAVWGSEQWTRIGDLPLRFFECLPGALVAAGTPVVRMCSGYAIWDSERMTWIPVPLEDASALDLGALVGTDDAVYSVGRSLRRYRIVRTNDGSIVAPSTMPVGVMQLDVPEGFSFVESFAPVQDPEGFVPEDESVGLVFSSDDSTAPVTCTVTSTYGYPEGAAWPEFTENGPIAVFRPGRSTLDETGNPINMLEGTSYQADDGSIGFAIPDENGSDVVFIHCPTSDDASAFAVGLWSPWEGVVTPDAVDTLDTKQHRLPTHCGIEYTELDGAFWLADVNDLPLLPYETAMRWADPFDEGTLSLLSDGSAIFQGSLGLVMRFLPAPSGYQPPGCY